MSFPNREVLLQWLDTLPTTALLRIWNEHARRLNVSKYRRRRHQLEKCVVSFRSRCYRPTEKQWRRLARMLQGEGLYSKKTAVIDIVERLKKL